MARTGVLVRSGLPAAFWSSSLAAALAERPDLAAALEEKGEALWQLGRKDEAVATWNRAVKANPRRPLAYSMLAGAVGGDPAEPYEKQAAQFTPNDPYFHYMVAQRLENIGMKVLAEKHFARAAELNPEFRSRREIEMLAKPVKK